MHVQNEEFSLETQDRITWHLAKVTGSFTVKNLLETRQAFTKILEGQVKHLVIDLSVITEMDSSSIGLLSNLYKRMRMRNGTLGLLNPAHGILSLLQDTGLTTILPIHHDIEALDLEFE